MKNTFLKTIYLSITVLFYGCAHKGLSNDHLKFNPKTSENGLIIGSITFVKPKPRYDKYFFHFKKTGENQSRNSTEIEIQADRTWKKEHVGNFNNGKTHIYAIQRKPGNYEIDKVRLIEMGMASGFYESYLRNFSIPIEVKKGEVTYVGEILFDENYLISDSIIKLKDNFVQDHLYFNYKKITKDNYKINKDIKLFYNNNRFDSNNTRKF